MFEDEEDEGMVNLLVADKSGRSILAPRGGCGQGIAYHYPGYGACMHEFCCDEVGERGWDLCNGIRGLDNEE